MKKPLLWAGAAVTAILLPIVLIVSLVLSTVQMITNPSLCGFLSGSLPNTVPERLNSVFTAAAKEYKVPAASVALVYYVENRGYVEPPPPYGDGKAWRVSYAGAMGPFQFLRTTYFAYRNSNPANQPGDILDLTDAAFAAANFLSDLGVTEDSQFGSRANPQRGTVIWALAAYNAGPAGNFGNSQTQEYMRLAEEEYFRTFNNASPAAPVANALVNICNEQGPNAPPDDTILPEGVCPAGALIGTKTVPTGERVTLCNVNGMVVNAKIAVTWQRLVDMARDDGINLTGGGYRTTAQQIELRKAHCGTSYYAIYEMPASQCTPDTARPGTSDHELALAVDLNNARSYSSVVYKWMVIHATPLGLVCRVPDEPWHWAPARRR